MSNDHIHREAAIDNLTVCLSFILTLDLPPIGDVLDDARLQGLPTDDLQRLVNAVRTVTHEGPDILWAYAERAGLGYTREQLADVLQLRRDVNR